MSRAVLQIARQSVAVNEIGGQERERVVNTADDAAANEAKINSRYPMAFAESFEMFALMDFCLTQRLPQSAGMRDGRIVFATRPSFLNEHEFTHKNNVTRWRMLTTISPASAREQAASRRTCAFSPDVLRHRG